MRRSLIFIAPFIVVLVLIACRRSNPEAAALLARADSLLNPPPSTAAQSQGADTPPAGGPQGAVALHLLDSVQHQARTAWPKADRMRYEVLLAEAMNKAYKDFTTDSVLKQVVRYYDRRGSRNQQLKARYLLGCAYRDMGEAPAAINAWQEAVDCADTLSKDCDYRTLYRVYGQMAALFYRQYLPEEQLEANKNFAKYTLLSGDTLSYIRGLLLKNDALEALGDTDAVLQNVEYTRQLYLERGMRKEAAQVYPSAIHIALDRGEYEKVDSMMQIYEKESGLFDEQGTIAPTREIYYYYKGLYLLQTSRPDSAEFQFRRLLNYENNLVDAYRGFVSLYLWKENEDSLRKYTILYEDAMTNYLEETQTQAIVQAERMYDYSRQQRIAAAQKRKADILALTGTLFVLALITTIAFIVRRFKSANEQERKKHLKVRAQYGEAIQKLAQVKREIGILQRNTSNNDHAMNLLKQEKNELAQQYENEIEKLKTELASYKETQDAVKGKADIISRFHTTAKPHLETDETGQSRRVGARAASEDEWNQLIEMVRLCYPRFYVHLMEHSLSDLRLHVCILTRLGFENKEIVTLAKSSVQSVSNARITLAKIFGLTSTKSLDDYLRNF